jgi:CRP/FNR family transcriptional regulator, cyclic AMP receptor protein
MSDAIRTYLEQLPFFAGLSSEQLNKLTSFATAARYNAQQRVFKSHTDADKFYIIRDGKVAVEVPAVEGEPLRVQVLGNGGILGWSWLIPPYRWSFDARALNASDIITVDGVKLREYCEQDHSLGYILIKRFAVLMAERLNASRVAAIAAHNTGHH